MKPQGQREADDAATDYCDIRLVSHGEIDNPIEAGGAGAGDEMIVVDADTVAATLPVDALADTLKRALIEPGMAPPRQAYRIEVPGGGGSLLTMPAWRAGGAMGVKLVTVFPGNAKAGLPSLDAAYLLMSAVNGAIRALIDGTALTEVRTAAISLLGRRLLAPTPRRMLMVGAGALAPHLVRAHAAGSALAAVAVWNCTAAKAQVLAAMLRGEGIPAEATDNLEHAAREADLICCATHSDEPLIRGEWLKDGAHLDLIGAYRPDLREADAAAIEAGGLAVDTKVALKEAGDLVSLVQNGRVTADSVPDLTALIAGVKPRPGRITVFKSVGTALADLATAEELMRRLDLRHDQAERVA